MLTKGNKVASGLIAYVKKATMINATLTNKSIPWIGTDIGKFDIHAVIVVGTPSRINNQLQG